MPHRIVHAYAYPFAIPEESYLLRDGEKQPLPAGADHRRERTPVLASGSNRSHEQLARKYARLTGHEVPVERIWLDDFDSVFASHITGYGSIAATVQHSPGTRVELAINWLDDDQLEIMHGTESVGRHYHFARLDRLSMTLDHGGALDLAFAYVTILGCLSSDEATPIALREVRAEGRRFPAMGQREVQHLVHARVGDGLGQEAFVLSNVEDPETRRAREARLRMNSLPFAWPHWEVLAV